MAPENGRSDVPPTNLVFMLAASLAIWGLIVLAVRALL
jgi:hypothetical protein